MPSKYYTREKNQLKKINKMANQKIDKLDKQILTMIAEDARVPFLEVARACNVSGAAIHQRIQKLSNAGIIKDGGLSVRYCICSALTACTGTAQGNKAIPTMFYGNPQCLELDLFSNYEINVSSDFAFTKLMDTILGDVELGADVVVKNGFVALTIPATA